MLQFPNLRQTFPFRQDDLHLEDAKKRMKFEHFSPSDVSLRNMPDAFHAESFLVVQGTETNRIAMTAAMSRV
jgi:hypothetical protein